MNDSITRTAWRTALAYALLAAAWIILSDYALSHLVVDPAILTRLQTYKGWLFVAVTSVLLFLLLRLEQRARRQTEAHYRQLFEASADALFLLNSQGRILDANQTAVARYGYTREELLRLAAPDLAAPELREQSPARIRQALVEGAQFAWRHQRKDGSELPVEIAARPIVLDGERRVLASVRDITEREQAEEALRTSEAKFSAAFHANPIPFAIATLDGTFVDVNPAYEGLTGHSREKIIGKNAFELGLVNTETRQRMIQAMQSSGGSLRDLEVDIRSVDGRARTILLSSEIISLNGIPHRLSSSVEITERKRAEESLLRSEQVFRLFVEHSPAAIAMLDREMKYIVASRRYSIDYRLGEQNLVGRSHYEVFPEIPERWKEIHQRCLAGAVEKCDQDLFPRADGTLDWVRWEIHPWYEVTGEVGGIILLSEVITERVQTEQALRESEERFRQIAENIQEVFWMTDPAKTQMLYISPAYEKVWGRTCQSLYEQPRSFLEAIHSEDRERIVAALEKQALGEYDEQYRIVQPDGSIRWIHDRAFPVLDESGDLYRIAGVADDITERKRAAEALRESEQRLSSVYDTVGDIIFHLAVEPGEQYRFISVNPAFLRTTGLPWEAVVGRRVSEVIPEPSLTMVLGKYRQAIQEKSVVRWEETSDYPTGRLTGEVSVAPVFDDKGQCTHLVGSVHDITERKLAEEALRESEAHLEEAQRIAHVGSWDWVAATDRPTWSRELCAILEVDPDKPVPSMAEQDKLYTPDSMARMRAAVEKTMQTGDPYEIELERVREGGSRRWLLARGERWFDEQGQLVGLRGTALDITERKRAEEALRLSEERFYKAFHASPDIIVLTSVADGRLVEVNESLERTTGYTHAEILEKTTAELQFWADPAQRDRYVELLRRDGRVRDLEVGFRIKSGEIRDTLLSGEIIELQDGRYILGVIRDITERKQAEEEIHRRAGELAALNGLGRAVSQTLSLQEVVGAAVSESLHAVQPDLAFIFLREGEGLNLAGFGPQSGGDIVKEFPGHHVGECLCGLTASQRRPIYSCDIHRDVRCTWEECKKAGLRSFAALPLLSGEETIGVLGLASEQERDFEQQSEFLETLAGQIATGVRNAQLHQQTRDHAATLEQRVVERTAELEVAMGQAQEADRLKSAFLATMSHELRTPLNSIIGFTGIVLQELPGPLNAEQARQLGMVQNSARHLLSLINDVLDISKIEAGQLELESEPFDVRGVIDRAIQTVAPLAEKKGLELVAEVASEVGQITGDRRRVEQVLLNLLNNGIKFTEQGEVRVECRVEEERLVTRVTDTGIGIRPEDVGKLFQMFQQIDSGIARQQEGTGLGLSISKRLVEMMGGEIWAESEWGQGSVFTFTLPTDPSLRGTK